MIRVVFPSQLDSYTAGLRELELPLAPSASGQLVLHDVICALDQRYPGMAFRLVNEQRRIRRNIAVFVGDELVRELETPLHGSERVQIVGALSGG